MRGRLTLRRPDRDEDGIALVAVIGTMAIVTVFLLSSLALVLQNTEPSRADQDAKAAIAAAQAGAEEYISRLNANDSYWTLGNADASNPAFSAAGRTIQGLSSDAASYRYQVLNTPEEIASSGQIRLQVIGTSRPASGENPVSRALTAILQPRGFLRYIYVSDVEVLDPALMSSHLYIRYNGSSYRGSTRYRYAMQPDQVCSLHYYEGRSGSFTATAANPARVWDTWFGNWASGTYSGGTVSGFSCQEIQWTTGDTVTGPLHSNDALQINGTPLFTHPMTESSWAGAPNPAHLWWGSGSPSSSGSRPVYAVPLSLPVGNQEMLQHVEPRVDDPGADPGPGCYYTGATRITFQGDTMKVLSPSTTNAPARCLNVASRTTEQTKDIPPVIYVDSTTNPCTYGAVGYPVTNEWTGRVTTDYSCSRGTAYVKGTATGQVTVAGKDDIVIVGDLKLTDGTEGTDIIGLVAGNYVWVWHPIRSNSTNLLSSTASVHTVQAAILSLRHSFLVQNWAYGTALSSTGNDASKLTVLGSLAQKYRGPVGTGTSSAPSSGYLKNYLYDERMVALQPPYFLKPESSPWQIAQIIDK
jgi:Tfp pilus assembly protein PilX